MNRLGLALISAFSVVTSVQAQQSPHDTIALQPALRRVDDFVQLSMQASNTPGLALALVDRSGLIVVRTYGYADLDGRLPVTPATRFEIGSISKSFTAIALLQLQAEGHFDPNRAVRSYLPWFTPASRWRPVTGHDLMTHTAGLPRDRDDVPSGPGQGYMVRERPLGSPPGSHWAYSNIGWQVLGQLLESLDGSGRYPQIIRRRILEPLDMSSTDAEITNATRLDLARGYESVYDDRPTRPTDPLAVAPWTEYASGDGSIVSTPADLGAYLTMLLNRGKGPNGAVLGEAGFAALSTPHAKTTRGDDSYGYGMFLSRLDGREIFYHGGGMLGYSSHLIGIPSLGIGAVVFVNGPGEASRVARFALRVLGAALNGDTLPDASPPKPPWHIEHPENYAGTYHDPSGDSLVFAASGDSLLLLQDGKHTALERYGEDSFLGPAPEFALFPIRFGRDSGGVTEVWYGGHWFAGPRYHGPRTFSPPKEWLAYTGHYRITQPWEPNFRIVLRKGRLWWVGPEGDEEELTPIGPAEFRVGEPRSADRLRFETILDGKAVKAILSGMTYYRFFTP